MALNQLVKRPRHADTTEPRCPETCRKERPGGLLHLVQPLLDPLQPLPRTVIDEREAVNPEKQSIHNDTWPLSDQSMNTMTPSEQRRERKEDVTKADGR